MPFNSFAFFVFLPTVFLLYWISPFRFQNRLLLVASYIFYGYWDARFLSLILASTIIDYWVGLKIDQETQYSDSRSARRKRAWLILSVCCNLGMLGVFKYFNFFVDSLEALFVEVGWDGSFRHLNIVLPVGISFYTFQSMSYTIDIYRGRLRATRCFPDFALFVAFFPQLVAGPIERAARLLPRIQSGRVFSFPQLREGLTLIFWGLFKKVYVADNLARSVDAAFAMDSSPGGMQALLGTYAFAFQIYCDFSGYSDIARGCSKCLGIELMVNFNHPYAAVNPSDFWRRWHISLSTWLRDYVYIPLGGNRHGEIRTVGNLEVTMLLGGLWHGASWTFVLWGAYQGLLLMAHRLFRSRFGTREAEKRSQQPSLTLGRISKMVILFQFICIGWIIFRCSTMEQAWDMVVAICTWRGSIDWTLLLPLLQFVGPLLVLEFIPTLTGVDNVLLDTRQPQVVRVIVCAVLFYLMALYGSSAQSFIYFQF